MGWGANSAWMWLLMGAATVSFWVLVTLCVRALIGGGQPQPKPTTDAMQMLRERLARGQISPEDIEHRRRLLTDGHLVHPPQDGPPQDGPPQDGPAPGQPAAGQHAMAALSRRQVLLGGLGLAGTAALAACTSTTSTPSFGTPAPAPPTSGQRVVTASLTPKPVTLDLGGPIVSTWGYGDTAPGALLRANAGDLLRITVDNQLPADTTVHWHGIRLRNAADGVPGVTQDPIRPGTAYTYQFTAPDPGTYFFHPHVGVQLDRGLYAPLVIDAPAEPGGYDAEWVVVLDDWVDGTGRTPDQVLARRSHRSPSQPVAPGPDTSPVTTAVSPGPTRRGP